MHPIPYIIFCAIGSEDTVTAIVFAFTEKHALDKYFEVNLDDADDKEYFWAVAVPEVIK